MCADEVFYFYIFEQKINEKFQKFLKSIKYFWLKNAANCGKDSLLEINEKKRSFLNALYFKIYNQNPY